MEPAIHWAVPNGCRYQKLRKRWKVWWFISVGRSVAGMHSLFSDLFSWLTCRFRGRVELELEVIALRHQLAVLRRQRPGRTQLFAIDRLIWVWLYRLWPRFLEAMVLVKPATVIQWHRQGFRLFWRWRSRSGRPSLDARFAIWFGRWAAPTRYGVRPGSTANCSSSASKSAKRPLRSIWCEGGEHLLRTGGLSCGITPKVSPLSTCSL